METVNQVNATTATSTATPATITIGNPSPVIGAEKTFTQAEVDKIVSERLQRDRNKYSDYEDLKAKAAKFNELEESNKTELEKANEKVASLTKELDTLKEADKIRKIRDAVAKEMNIPAELLTSDTEDGCRKQAEAIKEYAKPNYPSVNDGGEPQNTQGQATRDQFAAWLNSQK